jgi:murein DD-endopeptidase MepM/ murein hydrolase activator NlpD
MAAQNGGISAALTMELAGIFGGVIDFMLDTRQGDTFTVIYEEKYLNGEFIGNGQILAAQFINQGEIHTALRYLNANGEINYYSPNGESMRKAFLKNPVDFVRISSNFNPSRRHPILNTIRAHKGTDYAAPTGTPVVATADGRVTFAARNGTYGKLVVIKHNDRFETKYAHLNSYANGIQNGTRVRQGQVIGYVGSTGSATGPHLHYEFLMDGIHRNSRTIHDQLPKAESIAANEIPRFREQTQLLVAKIDTEADTTLAMLENQDTQ